MEQLQHVQLVAGGIAEEALQSDLDKHPRTFACGLQILLRCCYGRKQCSPTCVTAGQLQSDLHEQLSPLTFVPAECHSMNVDEHFAPFVSDYTDQATKLQRLAVSYDYKRRDYGRDLPTDFPDLRQSKQLRAVKEDAPDIFGDDLATVLAKCPESLTSCHLGGRGDYGTMITFLPQLYQPVQEHLRRLTNLDLYWCQVHTPTASVTHLEGLTSLSITASEVEPELEEVTKLTNLVMLDLTKAYRPRGIYSWSVDYEARPWSKFDAWPGSVQTCWVLVDWQMHCAGHRKCV